MEPRELAVLLAGAASDRKAVHPVLLDVRERASYTDFVLICSGTSDRHVQSIAEAIEKAGREAEVTLVGTEGIREGQWALVDFGSVVAHVFHQFNRDVYALERLWAGSPRIPVEDAEAASG